MTLAQIVNLWTAPPDPGFDLDVDPKGLDVKGFQSRLKRDKDSWQRYAREVAHG